jgi:BlaI family transcriptional regulator, penicillinase repressor
MASQRDTRPTDGELAILRVLWDRGPCTVRQVREALGDRGVRYTTTLKIMQNMAEKGLVLRDESRMTHVYAAAIEEGPTQRRLVGELLDRAFGGSAGKLAMAALAAGSISGEELREIRKLLKDKGTDNERTR